MINACDIMNILFIHQNFPAQFRHLSVAFSGKGHQVVAVSARRASVPGVTIVPYRIAHIPSSVIHPLAREHELKIIRAEAVAGVCRDLKSKGFVPGLIYVHPGWGEGLFLREVFPSARIIIYCEYYYRLSNQDVNFDPEFPDLGFEGECQLRMKNTCNLHALDIGDEFYSPTRWQISTYPEWARSKISLIHDGIDFSLIRPNPNATLQIREIGLNFSRKNKIITFASRNLEPLRGIHSFLRCLPLVLREFPDVHVLIVGGHSGGYGPQPAFGQSWKNIYLDEIDESSLKERIHFLGWVDFQTYLSVLQISTVHIYLTYPFILSWSLLEAMGVGAEVVGSDTAPVREVLPESELVDFFDHRSIADNLKFKLSGITEPNVRMDHISRARTIASVEKSIGAHMDLISDNI